MGHEGVEAGFLFLEFYLLRDDEVFSELFENLSDDAHVPRLIVTLFDKEHFFVTLILTKNLFDVLKRDQ